MDRLKVEFQDIKTILGEQLEKAGEYNAHLMNLRDKKDVRMADAADEHFRCARGCAGDGRLRAVVCSERS